MATSTLSGVLTSVLVGVAAVEASRWLVLRLRGGTTTGSTSVVRYLPTDAEVLEPAA